jgi:hypothetical protein
MALALTPSFRLPLECEIFVAACKSANESELIFEMKFS